VCLGVEVGAGLALSVGVGIVAPGWLPAPQAAVAINTDIDTTVDTMAVIALVRARH
jgi:hypothetical protein